MYLLASETRDPYRLSYLDLRKVVALLRVIHLTLQGHPRTYYATRLQF